jgi:hypothetical protein
VFISIPRRTTGLIKPPLGTLVNENHPLSSGLFAAYLLNEGGGLTTYDSAGTNYGSLTAAPTWGVANFGTGLTFNGSTQYVALNPITAGLSSNVSFCAWVNPATRVNSVQGIVVSEVASYSNYYIYLGCAGGSLAPEFAIYDGTHNPFAVSSTVMSVGNWTHIVGVRDKAAGQLLLYQNGVLVTTVTDTATVTPTYSAFNIGGQVNVVNRKFPGIIDNVLIYSRALTASEVQLLYTAPFCMMRPPKLYSVDVPASGGTGLIYQAMIG